MGSISSEDGFDDQLSDRFDSYSLSADVSESESCASDYSYSHYVRESSSISGSTRHARNSPGFSPPVPVMLPVLDGKHVAVSPKKMDKPDKEVSDIEMMKERFAKLLLGEDMSGGGKGVCTALAISNAITNLSATVFGELWKLEPLAPQKKAMWYREMEWLLCVSDSIVELTPSIQEFPGGGTFEVMVPRPRLDLYVNLPALKKVDAMLLSILDGFRDSEFHYADRGIVVAGADDGDVDSERYPLSSSSSAMSLRQEEKWWLPFPKVPPNGLSADARKRLQQCRECTHQILKAAMAINSGVLAEMEVPDAYLESLPKSGKACLGETIYHYITAHHFSPESLLDLLDFSSEYTTLEIANRIEASAHIWRLKYLKKQPNHARIKGSSWSGRVKISGKTEKSRILAHRSQILLHKLRLRFPGLPQTALDMSKIQYNKDVGHAILESYSRVMESLAFNIMARIDDLLLVDHATKQRAAVESSSSSLNDQERFRNGVPKQKPIAPSPFTIKHSSRSSSSPFTLPAVDSSGQGAGSSRETYHMVKNYPGARKIGKLDN